MPTSGRSPPARPTPDRSSSSVAGLLRLYEEARAADRVTKGLRDQLEARLAAAIEAVQAL